MLDALPTKLLYVEDDQDVRDMIASTFVAAGFDVISVPSAEEALSQLESGHFDIVVTDYNLIEETGAWLLTKASSKGLLARTAAIVLTSERHPAGVEGYTLLQKPVDYNVLIAAISDAVGQIIPSEPIVNRGVQERVELELVLYVTAASQESHKAIRNLHRALKPFDKSRFRLTVIDVANGGDEEWYQSLEADRVVVTPTLVKRKPGPKTWIVGTLAPTDAVEQMLASVLGKPGQA